MKKALAKFTRTNHSKHIVDVMPLVAAVFGVQCYLLEQFESGIDTGTVAVSIAVGLVAFVCGLFWYDRNHHIIVFEDRIESGFFGFGAVKTVMLSEIESIEAPKEERNFSTLIVSTKEGKAHIYYFVDYPKASKEFLEKQISLITQEDDEDSAIAA